MACFGPEPRTCPFTVPAIFPVDFLRTVATPIRMDQLKEGYEAMKCRDGACLKPLLLLPPTPSFGSLAFWLPWDLFSQQLCFFLMVPYLCSIVCSLYGHHCSRGGGAMVMTLMFLCLVLATFLTAAAYRCTWLPKDFISMPHWLPKCTLVLHP